MGNILILHSGLKGITNACLEMAKRLELEGHVVFSSSMKSTELEFENNKLNYLRTQAIHFNYLNNFDGSYLKFLFEAIFSKRTFFENLYRQLDFASFDELIKKNEIDLILIDMELHEYIIYGQHRKIPLILLDQFFSVWENDYNLPLNSKSTPRSYIPKNLHWKRSRAMGFIKTIGKSFTTLGLNRRQFILYLAKKFNLNRSQLKSFSFPLPFIHMDLPAISMTHPRLEFSQQAIPNLDYSYPMVDENRIEPSFNTFESEFERILELKSSGQKKLIVVTQSTMKGKSNKLLPKLMDALSQLKDCISIISIGDQFENNKRNKSSPNVFIYESIPQLKVFQHADLSINHGGIHTINECIHYKLPMQIFSGNRFDQNGNAVRVSEYGCGISHLSHHISVDEIGSEIKSILSNPEYKQRIEVLNNSYRIAKDKKSFENYIQEKLNSIRN